MKRPSGETKDDAALYEGVDHFQIGNTVFVKMKFGDFIYLFRILKMVNR